ncbi:YdeI/OmpD-associated family protein [Clostridium cuniculi]|uniref:YdeI/OmpD-associated family protein n=1 Tax=Clostridium cuniculi TaxID=2548455 RepID=UPI001054B70A|nr:YdeI/OmpD-associated family protein [Clostridium cuniculi]
MKKFNAEIKKIEEKDGAYIEIPFDVEEVYGAKRVKVKATFDGVEYRGSIVKMGLPCYIIGITKDIRKKIEKEPGDIIEVIIEKDEEERVVEIPTYFKERIELDNNIKEFWNTLSFSMQKKYVTWITSAKKEDTRNKRIDTAIEKLKNKEKMK